MVLDIFITNLLLSDVIPWCVLLYNNYFEVTRGTRTERVA